MKLTGKPVLNVGVNNKGIDYIIGDIHGCYDKLFDKLEGINFDFSKDRLFSVGDLVDRGPSSKMIVDLLDESWFFAVRGNHCQMPIDYLKGLEDKSTYFNNGGQWFIELDICTQENIAETLSKLPYVIQLKTPNGTIGIVHAQPVKIEGEYNWKRFIKGIKDDETLGNWNSVRERCTWDRLIAYNENELKGNIKGIYAVVSGHNTIPIPLKQFNYFAIDTGVVYNQTEDGYGYFTVLRADTLEFV